MHVQMSTVFIYAHAQRYTDADSDVLILYHGVQVPIAEDDTSVSIGYAAAMDAALQGEPCGASGPTSHAEPPRLTGSQGALQQDTDETTQSDISERPSVDDVESETGSTGALETRSLKDHKGRDPPDTAGQRGCDGQCANSATRLMPCFGGLNG